MLSFNGTANKVIFAANLTGNSAAIWSNTLSAVSTFHIGAKQNIGDYSASNAPFNTIMLNATAQIYSKVAAAGMIRSTISGSYTSFNKDSFQVYLPDVGNVVNINNGGISTSLQLTAGTGIKPSASSSVLDAYEEGTYTAVLTVGSGSIEVGTNYLKYTKIGNKITVVGYVGVASASSPGGVLCLNLPFTIQASSYFVGTAMVNNCNAITGFPRWFGTTGSTTSLVLQGSTTYNSATAVAMKAGVYLYISISYLTA